MPVSVTKRTQAGGSVNGIWAGVGVCCFVAVGVMSLKEGRSCGRGAACQSPIGEPGAGMAPATGPGNYASREFARLIFGIF